MTAPIQTEGLRFVAGALEAGQMPPDAANCLRAAADEIERLRHALSVIAGRAHASDNLMGNRQIAEAALDELDPIRELEGGADAD